jgi:hypothetical protein
VVHSVLTAAGILWWRRLLERGQLRWRHPRDCLRAVRQDAGRPEQNGATNLLLHHRGCAFRRRPDADEAALLRYLFLGNHRHSYQKQACCLAFSIEHLSTTTVKVSGFCDRNEHVYCQDLAGRRRGSHHAGKLLPRRILQQCGFLGVYKRDSEARVRPGQSLKHKSACQQGNVEITPGFLGFREEPVDGLCVIYTVGVSIHACMHACMQGYSLPNRLSGFVDV